MTDDIPLLPLTGGTRQWRRNVHHLGESKLIPEVEQTVPINVGRHTKLKIPKEDINPPTIPHSVAPNLQCNYHQQSSQRKWTPCRLALIITVSVTVFVILTVLAIVAVGVGKPPATVDVESIGASRREINIGERNGDLLTPYLPPASCLLSRDRERFDCIPEGNASEAICLLRKCCWNPERQDVPFCYFPSDYRHYCFTHHDFGPTGSSSSLAKAETSGFPNDVRNLRLNVTYVTSQVLRIKIFDPSDARYEVPFPVISDSGSSSVETNTYTVDFGTDSASFAIRRKDDKGTELFNTSLAPLVFSDQFLQISTRLPSRFLYGLGEHMDQLLRGLQPRKYSFFNYGGGTPSGNPEDNLYSHHPFYLIMEDDGRSHGVFLLNSNAMDILVHQSLALTYRAIGGILDFFFFMGPTPENVVQQYTGLVGRPFLPPYWSLGFHLCRHGYLSTDVTREAFSRNVKAGIPVEAMCNGIDYMDSYKSFTINPANYAGLSDFVVGLHKESRHYVMIFDPSVSDGEKSGTYPPYDEALKDDLLIKKADGSIFQGKVRSKTAVFPDYTHPKFPNYWTGQFQRFHNQIQFDGAFLDINEPECCLDGYMNSCPMDNPLEMPLYVPGGRPLQHHTICMSAQHSITLHYNLHNLFGSLQTKGTYEALKAVLDGKRPFVISRSTAPGHGSYGGHWTGDIASSWKHMRHTIPVLLNFNMFGIPLVGSAICGFTGNTTEELCLRWSQLGAFYPFSLNHNGLNNIAQDPAAMGSTVTEAAKIALRVRYYLLPYLYTLFAISSTEGSTVARPLFFEFPEDQRTYSIDTQFMWGSALMIVPVLWPEQLVTAYFPKGIWYDYYSGKPLKSAGEFMRLRADLKTINLAIRGGYIIPAQEPNTTAALSVSRRNPFELLVALDGHGSAEGQLISDDGDSLDRRFNNILLKAEGAALKNIVLANDYKQPMLLGKVRMMGVEHPPSNVWINSVPSKEWSYSPLEVLEINTLASNLTLTSPFRITWS